jgi:MEMO1 family protein
MIIRPPIAAGNLYPSDADDLVARLASLLLSFPTEETHPSALIVPHESIDDAGVTSAAAFRHLSSSGMKVASVVIIGAASNETKGAVLPNCDEFRTPLGPVLVDEKISKSLASLSFVDRNDTEHVKTNSIEVQLPFLQTCLLNFSIIPLLVGQMSQLELMRLFASLPNGPDTLTILSLDINSDTHECSNQIEQDLLDVYTEYTRQQNQAVVDADYRYLRCASKLPAYSSYIVN